MIFEQVRRPFALYL